MVPTAQMCLSVCQVDVDSPLFIPFQFPLPFPQTTSFKVQLLWTDYLSFHSLFMFSFTFYILLTTLPLLHLLVINQTYSYSNDSFMQENGSSWISSGTFLHGVTCQGLRGLDQCTRHFLWRRWRFWDNGYVFLHKRNSHCRFYHKCIL